METEGLSLVEQFQQIILEEDPTYGLKLKKERAVVQLAVFRKRLGLTQKQIAAKMGVTISKFKEIETDPWNISWDRIHAYSDALGTEFEFSLPGSA